MFRRESAHSRGREEGREGQSERAAEEEGEGEGKSGRGRGQRGLKHRRHADFVSKKEKENIRQ